jgi:predicted AlkP superfamily phosphohydrolase/phosphomutase
LNVEGREPNGIIEPSQFEAEREELALKLAAIPAPDGQQLGTKVFKPQAIYRDCRGVPPDLMVYFGDLFWRSVGIIGMDSIYTFENDTGPDDANHAQYGMFICHDPKRRGEGQIQDAHITDIGPSLLQQLDLPVPSDMVGRPLNFAR